MPKRIVVVRLWWILFVGAFGVGACTGSTEHKVTAQRVDSSVTTKPLSLRAGVMVSPTAGWTLLQEGAGAHAARFVKNGILALVVVEQFENHEGALGRLREIDAELRTPSRFEVIAGYPGIARESYEPVPQPGKHSAPPGRQLQVTRALAADKVVVRIEATIPEEIGDAAIADVEQLVPAVRLAVASDPVRATTDVSSLAPLPGVVHGAVQLQRDTLVLPSNVLASPPVGGSGAQPGFNGLIDSVSNIEAETSVAVSSNGQNIVVANNSNLNGLTYTTSNDYGETFPTNTAIGVGNQGDASLAFAQSGNFYFAFINAFANPTCSTGMQVSINNGGTFTAVTNPYSSTTAFPDQEHIAADASNASGSAQDRIYSVWRDFAIGGGSNCQNAAGGPTPSIVCSSNGGSTWTARATIESGDFPRVKVGPDGSVYAVYMQGNNIRLAKYSPCDPTFTNTFLTTVVTNVTPVDCTSASAIPGLDRCNNGNDMRSPTVIVDDTNSNHIYVAYAQGGGAGNENIFVIDSVNGGAAGTWRTPVQLNSAVTGHRFMPWVCATNGNAFVSWYDMRAGAAAGAASNDLTQFFGAAAFLNGAGNLTPGTEFAVSKTQDPLCASGWPFQTRSSVQSENCSVQPQEAGICCAGAVCGGACDFSNCAGGGGSPGCECPNAGQTCTAPTLAGAPKYGDFDEDTCAAGRFYMTWASATPPAGTVGANGINVYFACPPNANDINGTFADTTPPTIVTSTVPPSPPTLQACGTVSLTPPSQFDPCDSPPPPNPPAPFVNGTQVNLGTFTFGCGATTINWIATDATGNSSSPSAANSTIVNVNDVNPPVITPPGTIKLVGCEPTPQVIALTPPTFTDSCKGVVSSGATLAGVVIAVDGNPANIPLTQNAQGNFQGTLPIGNLTVQWTATNCSNNSSHVNQTVQLVAAPGLYAEHELNVFDHVTVVSAAGAAATIDNSGTSNGDQTEVFQRTSTGSILSVPRVELNGNTVTGNVQSGGTVDNNGATVSGKIIQQSAPTLPNFPTLTVPSPFPSGSNVDVHFGQTVALAPGAYGDVEVFGGGTLSLQAGTYFFHEFNVFPQGTVKIDTSGGVVNVDVKQSILWQGSVSSNGPADQFVLGYVGTQIVNLQTAFAGVVIAPSAIVQLTANSGTKYFGAYYGQQVIVNDGITVTESPFQCTVP
jgi:hypothetical protein